ncbi:MAG: 4Fe-4S binding protein [Planctomycetota bacterium]
MEAEYRRRTLDTHLRQFELFRDLSDSQIQTLKENVSLEVFLPGQVICEEGEPWSDANPLDVFIVRSGVVQVTVNAHLSLRMDDIRDWTGLCCQLAESRPDPKGGETQAARSVSPAAQLRVRTPASKVLADNAEGASPLSPIAPVPNANSVDQPSVPGVEPPPVEVSPGAKKPSPLEMMAAMRAKKAATPPEPSASIADPVQSSATADAGAPPPEAPPAKKPSTQELMAAMRAKKAGPPTEGPIPQTSPAASNPPSDRSPIESSPTPEASVDATVDLPLLKESRSRESGPPAYLVYSWLSDPVQKIVSRCAQGEPLADPMKVVILNALNVLAGSRQFLQEEGIVESLQHAEIQRKVASFPKGLKGIGKDWSELELRTTGRAVLSQIFPKIIRKPIESSGPPRVLAYLSRGDCIGEIAVINGSPRNASCIAYNHPSSEDARDFGNVELVRIPGTAFRRLMAESPQLKQRVGKLAAERISQVHSAEGRHTESDLVASTEFQQMGLFQGTRLLVIDLDSCTRCGDCVQACVDTHDDGYSRLFLDGPRYDRFLVPSSCRNCLNPVCMIGCPVGSIGRGENGQIEIYDWCIGCSVCADQCPYDSIQMHDTGLIPEESLGWLYACRRSLPDDWHRARRLSAGWKQGTSPFRWQGDTLREWSTAQPDTPDAQPLRLCFRHEFRLPKTSNARSFRLSINDDRRKGAIEKMRVKKSKVAGVWLNGEPLEWSGNSLDLEVGQFARADNLLAIEVTVERPAEYGQFVLSASLDAIAEAGNRTLEVLGQEVRPEMDLVTRRAAVCDLCSHLPSQQPACVTSCPHDAAIRINPLVKFPH